MLHSKLANCAPTNIFSLFLPAYHHVLSFVLHSGAFQDEETYGIADGLLK